MDRDLHRRRGQSLVELALLMPFLLWLCMGIVDFARVYYYDNIAINSARSGARLATDYRKTDTQIKDAVRADAGTKMPIAYGDIAIAVVENGPIPHPGERWAGDDVTVTVTYRFSPLTPLIQIATGPQLTVTRSATMKVLY